MNNNCIDCKFKKTAFSDLGGVSDEMVLINGTFHVQCLAGNNDKISDFYMKNNNTSLHEITDELGCFTKTEFAEKTDNLISMMDKFLRKDV